MTNVDSNGLLHYQHVAVCINDLIMASKTPEAMFSLLQDTHKFKLKGTGTTEYHLGCNFTRDELLMICLPLENILRR